MISMVLYEESEKFNNKPQDLNCTVIALLRPEQNTFTGLSNNYCNCKLTVKKQYKLSGAINYSFPIRKCK